MTQTIHPACEQVTYNGFTWVRCERAPVRDGMCEGHANAVDARDRKGAHANWKQGHTGPRTEVTAITDPPPKSP